MENFKKKDEATEEVVEETTVSVEETTEEVSEENVAEEVKTLIDSARAEVIASVKSDIEAIKKDQKELADKKVGLHATENKDAREALNSRTKEFFGALLANDTMKLKDMSEGTGSAGGFTVDTELDATIQHLLTDYGVARREMNFIQLSSNQIDLTNLAVDIDAYWTDEGAAKTSDDVQIGRVTLTLNKLATIVPMTDELIEDSEIDIVDFVTRRIAENISKKEDQAFFDGDGTAAFGGYTGVLQTAGVNNVDMDATNTAFTDITADDLINMQDATPQGAQAGAKYYMNRTIMSQVRKLQDTTGQYIYQSPSESGPATIWGKPVVLVEAMPAVAASAISTAFVLYGDLRKAATVGVRGGLRIKLSQDATVRNTADSADINLYVQDQTGLRVVERVGYVVVIATAVTTLTTAAV